MSPSLHVAQLAIKFEHVFSKDRKTIYSSKKSCSQPLFRCSTVENKQTVSNELFAEIYKASRKQLGINQKRLVGSMKRFLS